MKHLLCSYTRSNRRGGEVRFPREERRAAPSSPFLDRFGDVWRGCLRKSSPFTSFSLTFGKLTIKFELLCQFRKDETQPSAATYGKVVPHVLLTCVRQVDDRVWIALQRNQNPQFQNFCGADRHMCGGNAASSRSYANAASPRRRCVEKRAFWDGLYSFHNFVTNSFYKSENGVFKRLLKTLWKSHIHRLSAIFAALKTLWLAMSVNTENV